MKQSRRKFIVFTTLMAVLTLTSALLLALAPAPLTPDAANSLFAIDAPQSLDLIFETKIPTTQSRWKYIYVHQSQTPAGNALTLGENTGGLRDHFVIGNGDGAADGEIQIGQRWDQQTAATPPTGATEIDPACVSICLVGDFDHAVPTPTQMRRVAQLVSAIQGHYRIGADQVMLVSQPVGPAGIGSYFPTTAFREQLLP